MNAKENVLDAWIMVEHLSEGDINLKDGLILSCDYDSKKDYYSWLESKINKKKLEGYKKRGVVLYFNIFPFKKIIEILEKLFSIKLTNPNIYEGNKFSFALYFDKELKLNSEMTFVTASYYIHENKNIPKVQDLNKFEECIRKKISDCFVCDETDDYSCRFNSAIENILKQFNIKMEDCLIQVVKNLEADATNLHSFFIGDLEKAKSIESLKLNSYITGECDINRRISLDSRKDSKEFASDEFRTILQPKNYPIARFPSNPTYALSFMQQVAVNLAIGYDDEQIRSVNGPPGTGKTTLLKDIFAELITQQAYDIVNLPSKKIKCNNASIGIMPKHIAEKGILVASSNNGAVQNIVNELPLRNEIDEAFYKDIHTVDYFKLYSNSKLKSEWKKDEKGNFYEELTIMPTSTPDKYWGLFSLEGGKKENINNIITSLKHIVKYLEEDYKSNDEIYNEFIELHREVCAYRQQRQSIYKLDDLRKKVSNLEKDKEDWKSELEKIQNEKTYITQLIEALKLQKPYLFQFIRRKKYNQQMKSYSDILIDCLNNENKISEKISLINLELEKNSSSIEDIEEFIKRNNVKILDLSVDYEELHLTNPWFDIGYRKLQSRLFICALKVRKQFLYENRRNIKSAYIIWSKQKSYAENKMLISEAWNWINMTIPVISTTFASFSRMFKNINEESIGHLFIDEAGQALPQASVGAIMRSKKVMVVGDPAQIKPVLSIDESILAILRNHYEVSETHLSEDASTQTLVDAISLYGFYKEKEKTDWIGIPLWVHRRCKSPMFDISNEISYGGNMVQGIKDDGLSAWYSIGGVALDKYVPEQGIFLKKVIEEMAKKRPEILDKSQKDIIYVISPFKNVADILSKELDEIGFTRYGRSGKPTNIGTVHTFQGKEAPIVFLVLGSDDKSKGAANWAMGTKNPNIMNVAATRAKEEFYVIGDRELYKKLNSDVINTTDDIINRFYKKLSSKQKRKIEMMINL